MFKTLLKTKYEIKADYAQWRGNWIHYSDTPMLKTNPNQFHQDPAGIYFFPENFKSKGGWHHKKYKFVVQVADDLKILDLAHLTLEKAQSLVTKFGFDLEAFNKEIQGKESEVKYYFWQFVKNKVNYKKGYFNKLFREAGYDAIFDDTDTIFSGETQLILLNPTKIKKTTRVDLKGTGFPLVKEIAEYIKKQAESKYQAVVEIKLKGQGRHAQDDKASATVSVREKGYVEGNYDSSKKYATWEIRTGAQKRQARHAEGITVQLKYSNPKVKGNYIQKDFRDFDMKMVSEAVERAHRKIFSEHLANLSITHSLSNEQIQIKAKDGSAEVGELLLKIVPDERGKQLHLVNIEVPEDQRRKGIATAMLRYAETIKYDSEFKGESLQVPYRLELWKDMDDETRSKIAPLVHDFKSINEW